MSNQKKIVYIGTSGFPFGLAQVERQKLIAKGLLANKVGVLIISRYGIQPEGKEQAEFNSAEFEGIPFQYASGYTYRPNSFFRRNFLKFYGLVNEFFILRVQKKQYEGVVMLVSTLAFYNILYYKVISKLLGITMVIDNIEYFSSMQIPKSKFVKLDNYLYDNYSHKLADKVIGISDFLINVAKKGSPDKPVLKIPSIVDFSKFRSNAVEEQNFFLYCGQAAYFEVIAFIIDAFEMIDDRSFSLYLVSNGHPMDMQKLKDRISSSKKRDIIRLFSGVPFQQLVDLYMTSKALLIPLRNTRQDIARFPHKIGEYCAAGKPIVSTNIGEVASHFKDGVNAVLAETYDYRQFSEKMKTIIDNPELSATIGKNGFEFGKMNFDHLQLGAKIKDFIAE
ncbi:glycosyltransferase [Flavihumibacter fluvii]|uniref:glycosyltransferase n=1 Tax=Flavihumibacter fluvii TaxID=2838157 RepID=UPI001BDDF7EF|nr:glycosyltransferase [Flavihumibacter fluvii]ULQ54440.1 glycosyltransferase [Flavihumibacter fluvii]